MDRPMTCTCRPLEASSRRSYFIQEQDGMICEKVEYYYMRTGFHTVPQTLLVTQDNLPNKLLPKQQSNALQILLKRLKTFSPTRNRFTYLLCLLPLLPIHYINNICTIHCCSHKCTVSPHNHSIVKSSTS